MSMVEYKCEFGICKPRRPQLFKLKCMCVDYISITSSEDLESKLIEFLESCAQGYKGKIYKNENNCVALLSSNKGLVILKSYNYIIQMPHNEINVYSKEEFGRMFEFKKLTKLNRKVK